MNEFVRFPHTPHLAWLGQGQGQPRDDKVLTGSEVKKLLASEIVVEEKVDGANIGFSAAEDGELRVQSRGSYLNFDLAHLQFRPLRSWLSARASTLSKTVSTNLVLFGEWCYATHGVAYDRLPDWFLGFDVYDRAAGRFWDCTRRDALLTELRLQRVPFVASRRFSIDQLRALLSGTSQVGSGRIEGLIVRQESDGFTTARAKLVRAEFTQAIGEHWSRGALRPNSLAKDASPWR